MATPVTTVRVPPELDAAVRASVPELADETPSVLIRVALAMLAGYALSEAMSAVRGPIRTSPVPRDFSRASDAA